MEEPGAVVHVVEGIIGLLLVAVAILAGVKKLKVPYTVALVLGGLALAQLGRLEPEFLGPVLDLELPPEIVFLVFLPTLIFESAFNLNVRDLRENLWPVLILAVPGLLLSTAMIGGVMVLATGMSWPVALLLGSILSATDPVAVISLFKQLGAPKRLTVLVEGESLFNDATAIVVSNTILMIVLAGTFTTQDLLLSAGEFLVVFVGGICVGWAVAVLAGMALGRVESDAFMEVTITTILAYLSFILAEETLDLSGVMATVTAGMVIGGWGKTKISPSVAEYLERFWEYLATVANALVFLMIGLRVDLGALGQSVGPLFWVVLGMLGSRALVVYGFVPFIGKVPGSEPINRKYQTVMFWGGLRGAIALAIALSLPEFPGRDQVVALTMGAVLFTLLVPGMTVERIVKYFGLHVPPLSDRLARIEGLVSAKHRTLEQVPVLLDGGFFSPRIAEDIRQRCEEDIEELMDELAGLRSEELDLQEERRLLYLRCFGEEKTSYYTMFSKGHLSEAAYRDLTHSIELQTEAIRHEGRLPEYTLHPPSGERIENVLFRVLDQILGFGRLAERLRAGRTARDYEVAWARSRGSSQVLDDLDELAAEESSREDVGEEVRAFYEYWHANARSRLDLTAEQFPEFVSATQERLAERLVLHAEREAIEEKAHAGTIPEGVAEAMLEEMADELREIRASKVSELAVDPKELLRKVPFFHDTPENEFEEVAQRLRRRTAPAGEAIISEGDKGSSLFLVARGVIRVSRQTDGKREELATLLAGDFFGEMALLHGERRSATCRAVTPCALYELRRQDLEAVRSVCPAIQEALEAADRRRRAELEAHQEEGAT